MTRMAIGFQLLRVQRVSEEFACKNMPIITKRSTRGILKIRTMIGGIMITC